MTFISDRTLNLTYVKANWHPDCVQHEYDGLEDVVSLNGTDKSQDSEGPRTEEIPIVSTKGVDTNIDFHVFRDYCLTCVCSGSIYN